MMVASSGSASIEVARSRAVGYQRPAPWVSPVSIGLALAGEGTIQPEAGTGPQTEATIPLDDCLRDSMLALLAAHDAARVPREPADLIVFGGAAVCSLALVALGLVAMKGAVADITGVVMAFPPSSDPDDEKDRQTFRAKAAKEYVWLLSWRCMPGIVIAAAGVIWLSVILCRVLFRTS